MFNVCTVAQEAYPGVSGLEEGQLPCTCPLQRLRSVLPHGLAGTAELSSLRLCRKSCFEFSHQQP